MWFKFSGIFGDSSAINHYEEEYHWINRDLTDSEKETYMVDFRERMTDYDASRWKELKIETIDSLPENIRIQKEKEYNNQIKYAQKMLEILQKN